jgi:hypothetical protein
MRENGVRFVTAQCEACNHQADVLVDALPETAYVPHVARRLRCSRCNGKAINTRPAWHTGLKTASDRAPHHDGFSAVPRLSPFAGGDAFAVAFAAFAADAASNLASATRSGSSRGARGYLSSSMARRIAAVTAASSSSGRSIIGMEPACLARHNSAPPRPVSALIRLNQRRQPIGQGAEAG